VLGVPCLTLRTTTERPVTVTVIAGWAASRRPPDGAKPPSHASNSLLGTPDWRMMD
jgi:hypothetical protein